MKANTAHINTEEITVSYLSGVSGIQIAKDHGVSPWSIFKRLREAGVEVRPDGVRKSLGLAPLNAHTFRQIVDGLLLGDGSICKAKPSLRIEQSAKRDGWLDELTDQLNGLGVRSNTTTIPPKVKHIKGREIRKDWSRVLYTTVCNELREERVRWYPDGIKRIPPDLQLTPRVVALWFAGDGTYDSRGSLFFCTNGFLRQEVELLAEGLTALGIRARCAPCPSRTSEFKVSITEHDAAQKLKELMSEHLPQCCEYKLQHVRKRHTWGKFTWAQVQEIRQLYAEGAYQKDLALRFGVSQAAISQIVLGSVYARER